MLGVFLDTALCTISVWLSLALRLEVFAPPAEIFYPILSIAVGIAVPVFWLTGLYQAVNRYSGARALGLLARAVGIYGILLTIVLVIIGIQGIPRSIGVFQPMVFFLFLSASRWMIRAYLGGNGSLSKKKLAQKILIYGAGSAGRQLAANLTFSTTWRFCGFVDDNAELWDTTINGYPVYNPQSVGQLAIKEDIRELWLAMPTVTSIRRREIIESVRQFSIHVRTLPAIFDIHNNGIRLSDVRELDAEDLLGRTSVEPDRALLKKTVSAKTVLITGAGGSIGSEICRQAFRLHPKRMVLVDCSEYALYKIYQELEGYRSARSGALGPQKNQTSCKGSCSDSTTVEIIPILASVTDEPLMARVFDRWRPETVFHGAAFKHVPLVESNVCAAVYNNVWGTYICASQATRVRTSTFILISTDKAVHPTNVMGVSKRLAELVVQAINDSPSHHGTFSSVRFGNVLGSSGSVVPLFRQQIMSGGPLTLTHPEVTRYFMTISEATELVLQAAGMARGGEVFILDMGAPVKIYDLARRMIQLLGFTERDGSDSQEGIAVKVIGLRVGEKLHEELLIDGNPEPTEHPKIMRA